MVTPFSPSLPPRPRSAEQGGMALAARALRIALSMVEEYVPSDHPHKLLRTLAPVVQYPGSLLSGCLVLKLS